MFYGGATNYIYNNDQMSSTSDWRNNAGKTFGFIDAISDNLIC